MTTDYLLAYTEKLIRSRRAIRSFRPDPVPEETLRAVFTLAAAAPSSSNTQPWQVEVVSGAARNRLSEDLLAAHAQQRRSPDFLLQDGLYSGIYQERRSALGAAMYQALGIGREDVEARSKFAAEKSQVLRRATRRTALHAAHCGGTNFCGYRHLRADASTRAEYGIGSCPQGILGAYANTIRESLGIKDRKILLGISFGYTNPTAPLNNLPASRAELGETTRFHS
ncbi:nitroreductase [Streptomyces sp. NPDC052015]|uniref:nitroreductase n=1 Tax=Streptomyces sp. NPDC052015 TaxID=3154755 RepID=UPI00343782E7